MQKTFLYPLKIDRKQGHILKVTLSSTSKPRVLSFVRDSISHNSKFFIVTPNSEIILQAQNDPKLVDAINSSDLALPDGVGPLAANEFLVLKVPKIYIFKLIKLIYCWILYFYVYTFDSQKLEGEMKLIKGREMFLELAKLANKKRWKIFLLGGKDDEAEAAAEVLSRSLKGVRIGYDKGPVLNSSGEPVSQRDIEEEKNTIDRINKFAPQILFVGLGAPKQEKWTAKWLAKLNIGGAMVVGGAFNYISGETSLPPKWMENSGLEWLWRLITQPQRLSRIFNAVIIFPLKVFWYKLAI